MKSPYAALLMTVPLWWFAASSLYGDPPAAPSLQPIAWWAVPSNSAANLGHYVGGGCTPLLRGEPRRLDEGTWGWDYQGCLIPRHVNLGWWHGRRYQGGTGAYRTDGPHYHEAGSGAPGVPHHPAGFMSPESH